MDDRNSIEATPCVSCACTLGEGPVWSGNKLWWVDIHEKRFHCWTPGDSEFVTWSMPERIGFAVPTKAGDWLVGLESGIYRWSQDSQEPRGMHLFGDHPGTIRFNDGKCAPDGRLWAGTMHLKAMPGRGSLYRVDSNGCERMLSNLSISNGLAWDTSKGCMYFIDTPSQAVSAFAYDSVQGTLSNERTAAEVPTEMGAPDGMTIDTEGMLWVALWGGFGVVRINPSSGKILESIGVPAPNVTSCTFGGEDLDTLFITTARIGMSKDQIADHPNAGAVFSVQPGVGGLPVDTCNH